MGDRIILMQDGVIQQSATPTDIYEHPKNLFVASFIGSPQINTFRCTKTANEIKFDEFNGSMTTETLKSLLPNDSRQLEIPDGKYVLGIRPEDFTVGNDGNHRIFTGKVYFVEILVQIIFSIQRWRQNCHFT